MVASWVSQVWRGGMRQLDVAGERVVKLEGMGVWL